MRISVAQTKPVKGNVQKNIDHHLKLIDLAIAEGVDLIIFPELSLSGYEPSLATAMAIRERDNQFDIFQTVSNTHQISIGVGIPTQITDGICITLLLFQPYQSRQVYSKKYLHVDEEPFFVSGENFPTFPLGGIQIAPAICFELSVSEHAEKAHQHQADVYIASVAKSAKGVAYAAKRLADIAETYGMTVLMSNCVGPSEGFNSAGGSAVWNTTGILKGQLDETQEGILIYDMITQDVIKKQQADHEIQANP